MIFPLRYPTFVFHVLPMQNAREILSFLNQDIGEVIKKAV
jgi:hypothetical protein